MNIYFKKNKKIFFKWFVINLNNEILGRLITKITSFLIKKYKKNMNFKYNLIINNHNKFIVTGKKNIKKIYYHHSGYPGGLHKLNYNTIKKKFSYKILFHAIKGMLPKNYLGSKIFKRIKFFFNLKHKLKFKKFNKIKFNNFYL